MVPSLYATSGAAKRLDCRSKNELRLHLCYQEMIEQNNMGATLFRNDPSHALKLFRRALQAAICLLNGPDGDKRPSRLTPPAYLYDSATFEDANKEESKLHHGGMQSILLADQTFFRPFRLVKGRAKMTPRQVMSNASSAFAIILFNTALVHHRIGLFRSTAAELPSAAGKQDSHQTLSSPPPGQDRLKRARSGYRMATAALRKLGLSGNQPCGRAKIDLLMMAIQNNMAHMAYMDYHFQECQDRLHKLIQFTSGIRLERYQDEDTAVLVGNHIALFVKNAEVVLQCSPNSAPAA